MVSAAVIRTCPDGTVAAEAGDGCGVGEGIRPVTVNTPGFSAVLGRSRACPERSRRVAYLGPDGLAQGDLHLFVGVGHGLGGVLEVVELAKPVTGLRKDLV